MTVYAVLIGDSVFPKDGKRWKIVEIHTTLEEAKQAASRFRDSKVISWDAVIH